ncbi:MAG: selenocysteine-specific translation elongation factor [Pirellulales bacterium]|nr:selenocysteine-specific translation elongation factor [Pirellulales bacterium]
MLNITLGTAGHIDHGKTALVKALTGCETDRLKEEKERGMSIDLGYAPCRVADLEVGIVDVPGHENFIKTMVAGASGMDGVILVVAADDGIMPQTREHLDILTLLGVRHGLTALTKIDRVDAERRLQVQADLAGFLRGTFLEGAPILPLSNVTGEGFDPFLEALQKLVESIPPRRIDGVFRLPLDRAFSAKGFGTVAAGIPIAGSATLGDEVVLLPQNAVSRIKRIEVYGRPGDTVLAGQCAALNLGHCDAREVARGDVLTLPGYFSAEEFFVCRFRLLPHEKIHLKNASELKFHTGTSEVNAVLYLLEKDELSGGGEQLIQLRTKRPIVAGPGDPFILRTFSPVQTIGGGTIIEAVPRRLKRNRPGVIEDLRRRAEAVADELHFIEYAVREAEDLAVGEADLARRTKILRPRLQEILSQLIGEQKILILGSGLYLHRRTADQSGERLSAKLAEYHRRTPESPGMTPEQVRQACPWQKPVLEGFIALQKSAGRIVEQKGRLALAGHRPTFQDQDVPYIEAIEALFRQQLFNPPGKAELAEKTGAPPAVIDRLLRSLQEHQRLVAVDEGLIFHREAVEQARKLLIEHIQKEGRLESVQFKYLLDTTRKFALPLLDYFDRSLLRRAGNTRYLRTPPG